MREYGKKGKREIKKIKQKNKIVDRRRGILYNKGRKGKTLIWIKIWSSHSEGGKETGGPQ